MSVVQLTEPRRRTRARLLTFDPKIACPAGQPVFETPGGAGCRCAIEDNVLSALREPSSLFAFCMGGYALCTTWEREKQRIEQGRMTSLLDEKPPEDVRRFREDLVERSETVEVTTYYQPE